FELLGMVNNYYPRKNRRIVQKSLPDIAPWEISHFYLNSNQKLSKILFDALNSLESKRQIEARLYRREGKAYTPEELVKQVPNGCNIIF
ncbi:MAG: hypothetical protein FWD23_16160, partial [Oscillospiraceae bacterium]|nr:hypothetical protein [Oscillospiraceae bacterium]